MPLNQVTMDGAVMPTTAPRRTQRGNAFVAAFNAKIGEGDPPFVFSDFSDEDDAGGPTGGAPRIRRSARERRRRYPCPYLNPYPYPYPYPLARTRAAPREGAHRESRTGPRGRGTRRRCEQRRATMGPAAAAAAGGWDITPRARGTTKDDAIRGARRRRRGRVWVGRRRCSFLHQSTFGKIANRTQEMSRLGCRHALTPSTAALRRSNRLTASSPVPSPVASASRSMSAAHTADNTPPREARSRGPPSSCDVQERFRTVIHHSTTACTSRR